MLQSARASAATSTLALFIFAGTASAQYSFTRIGDLPGGTFTSYAQGISGDGSTVVGYSIVGASQGSAFKFVAGTLTDIGDLPGGTLAGNALATNIDGNIIAGQGNGPSGTEAISWTSGNNPVGLGGGFTGGLFGSSINASNADGSVLVGSYTTTGNDIRACKWVNGVLTPLDSGITGYTFIYATGVSDDGSVIAGIATDPSGDYLPARMTGSTFELLPTFLSGDNFYDVGGVSADGRVIVGNGQRTVGTSVRNVACRWVDGQIEYLGNLGGSFILSRAYDCNADGSVVVGYSNSTAGLVGFIWTQADGMRNLKTLASSPPYNLTSSIGTFPLTRATAISDDGLVIAGYGKFGAASSDNEGFVLNLREATQTCFADYNQDGGVDGVDVEAFFLEWAAGVATADVNQDGGVDGVDVEAFFIQWTAGGC
jgi:probable HAF family extracellular repeat protein